MGTYVITIAREFGSSGHLIAKRLSEILGVAFFDREIVETVSKDLDLPVATIESREEQAAPGILYRIFPLGTEETAIQNKIFEAQKQVIKKLVEQQDCVIVGRCSDFVLEGRPDTFHVYIYSDFETRMETCEEKFHLNRKEAEKLLHTVDRAREAYHKNYAGYLPGDIEHKNLIVNSATFGVEGTAQLLADTVRAWIKRIFLKQ